ncbi:MAG: cation-transporting P-type ATPase, partial [Desulfobulbaceae bacterium]|nr:cation-transporting P-type ATPase [Desulfobulbaceae bacterium]
MKICLERHWHHLSTEEVSILLETSEALGLDTSEVHRRLELFGDNRLVRKKGKSPQVLFLLQFHQPLVYILLAATVVTSLLREWVDAGVIFGVVLVNAIIGFVQEAKAVKAIEALTQSLISTATVFRGNERKQISATELVPGDIVLLQSGDKVPADLRLLSTRELQVDESALTGESVPVRKQSDLLAADTLLADRTNMAYSSSLVTYGIATGVVVATGKSTEIGRINELIASADILATPLTKKITRFSELLLYVILGLAAITFLVGVLRRGEAWIDMFMAVVALAVGAIPEGLPAAVTITLAIGVNKMARRHAIIRKLPAVETLGSATVICSDKTGTLTQNQMTVQEMYAGGALYLVSGVGYAAEGHFTREGASVSVDEEPALRECLVCGLLCNDSALIKGDEGEWRVEGDPTEAALVVAARKAGLEQEALALTHPRIDVIPFESQYQYMATLHECGKGKVLYLKGSVESVLSRCHRALSRSGETMPLSSVDCHRTVAEIAEKGLRVLAFARMEWDRTSRVLGHHDLRQGLTFIGLQGMIDPPRPEAVAAVQICRRAGIRVKMITGDHAITAAAIARQIGLVEASGTVPGYTSVLNGRALAELTEAALVEAAERTAVFARVAPEQKLRLVEALQAGGHVVAMTGDGVNDAPALRQANIGIAMGVTGTEVAKEAADMLLADDNFSSIAAAVEEGRGVYDNLVKFITWTLPTNLGEGLVILAAVFTGAQLPILPVQILWINMTTAVLLGLMLAFEPKESGLMDRPPLDPAKPLLTMELITRICLVGFLLLAGAFGLFKWALQEGYSLSAARTCAVNVFVFGEMFYLFNCRSLRHSSLYIGLFGNRLLLVGVALMIGLQLLFTYLPAMHIAFGSQEIGLRAWSLILVGALLLSLVVEGEKAIRRWRSTATSG